MAALLSASTWTDQHQITLLLLCCSLRVYVPMRVKPIIHLLSRTGPNFFCHKQKSRYLRLLRGSKGSREQLCAWVLFALHWSCSGSDAGGCCLADETTACTWGFNPNTDTDVRVHVRQARTWAVEQRARFCRSCRKASVVLICNWKRRLYCMTQKQCWERDPIL